MEASCETWIDAFICAGEATPLNTARIYNQNQFLFLSQGAMQEFEFWVEILLHDLGVYCNFLQNLVPLKFGPWNTTYVLYHFCIS